MGLDGAVVEEVLLVIGESTTVVGGGNTRSGQHKMMLTIDDLRKCHPVVQRVIEVSLEMLGISSSDDIQGLVNDGQNGLKDDVVSSILGETRRDQDEVSERDPDVLDEMGKHSLRDFSLVEGLLS
jgi:hypothetical protein